MTPLRSTFLQHYTGYDSVQNSNLPTQQQECFWHPTETTGSSLWPFVVLNVTRPSKLLCFLKYQWNPKCDFCTFLHRCCCFNNRRAGRWRQVLTKHNHPGKVNVALLLLLTRLKRIRKCFATYRCLHPQDWIQLWEDFFLKKKKQAVGKSWYHLTKEKPLQSKRAWFMVKHVCGP